MAWHGDIDKASLIEYVKPPDVQRCRGAVEQIVRHQTFSSATPELSMYSRKGRGLDRIQAATPARR